MIEILMIAISAVLQFVAAFMSFRLVPLTGKKIAWSLIATALLLMALRRCVPLVRLAWGQAGFKPDLAGELIALAISLLLVIGISLIAPIFVERKRAEEEVRRLNNALEEKVRQRTEELEEANKELESFSYSIAHDLRAPLRVIDGFSQALAEDYTGKPLDETGKIYLGKIRKATHLMGHLIDDLLKLSRVSLSDIKREPVDLSRMAEALIHRFQQDHPGRTVEGAVQEGVTATGDYYLLEMAMRHLVDNAWKFTGKTDHPRIAFGTTEKDGQTVYFLQDNGAGFDMAYADRLFNPFRRLHGPNEFPGTGIGLATMKRIIDRHGGDVWAEGAVGKGATFYFTLP